VTLPIPGPAAGGRAIFYTRDSTGDSELATVKYVEWAAARARSLGLTFDGTPRIALEMTASRRPVSGDLYIDFGISGDETSRPALDRATARAFGDPGVSHFLCPSRERLGRFQDLTHGMALEKTLQQSGLTVEYMEGGRLEPLGPGEQSGIAQLLVSPIEYHGSASFLPALARKVVDAKLELASRGRSIGGEAPYGFCRWLCSDEGVLAQRLVRNQTVTQKGYHVVFQPSEPEFSVVRRILAMLAANATLPEIARALNADEIPSPGAGRMRREKKGSGALVETGIEWTPRAVGRVADTKLLTGAMEYGRRSSGKYRRMAGGENRVLTRDDLDEEGRPRTVPHAESARISAPVPVPCEALLTPDEFADIRERLVRGRVAGVGTPRKGSSAPNPLSCRVFDTKCGSPMHRRERRGHWKYECGLYGERGASACDHNTVDGPAAVALVLSGLKQRSYDPGFADLVRQKIREKLSGERERSGGWDERGDLTGRLAQVELRLKKAATSMSVEPLEELRRAMREEYLRLSRQRDDLRGKLAELPPRPAVEDLEAVVDRAMSGLNSAIGEPADSTSDDWKRIETLFARLNVRLDLRFGRRKQKRRDTIVVAGGRLALGADLCDDDRPHRDSATENHSGRGPHGPVAPGSFCRDAH